MHAMQDILTCVAQAFGVRGVVIRSRTRPRPVVEARWAVMLIARHEGHSSPRIGMYLHRNHATVLHGAASGCHLARTDADYAMRLHRAFAMLDATVSPEVEAVRARLRAQIAEATA